MGIDNNSFFDQLRRAKSYIGVGRCDVRSEYYHCEDPAMYVKGSKPGLKLCEKCFDSFKSNIKFHPEDFVKIKPTTGTEGSDEKSKY